MHIQERCLKRVRVVVHYLRVAFWFALMGFGQTLMGNEDGTTYPSISETVSPVEELRISETAYAAIRKPPGEGPFPAVVFLHGGLGQSKMTSLRAGALTAPTQARFLAWGYVTVNATRRNIARDPQDRGVIEDTLEIIRAVKAMPQVEASSVTLYGGSGGGTLAIEVAGRTDLAAVAAGEPATIIYMGMFTKEHVVRDETGKVFRDRRWDVMNGDSEVLYTSDLRSHTREKMKHIRCPILIMHGDRHALKKFNFDVFVPELKALGIETTMIVYPGENHGFYWGRGRDMAMPLKANRDADAFFKKHIKVQPRSMDPGLVGWIKIESKR